jgi:hypothetical protein
MVRLLGRLQNVAVISSMQITPALGIGEVFVRPPAPRGCCGDCAPTGDAAKSSSAINVNFFIEWLLLVPAPLRGFLFSAKISSYRRR